MCGSVKASQTTARAVALFDSARVCQLIATNQIPSPSSEIVLAVQSISTLLPFTPGGVGTQQGFLVYVFSQAASGISKTSVLSFSIGMYVAVTVLNVLLGFGAILLMLRTLRWRRLVLPEKEKAYARGP